MIPRDAWDEGEPGRDVLSGVAEGEDHPSRPPRAVEGEDVPKATRNVAHG